MATRAQRRRRRGTRAPAWKKLLLALGVLLGMAAVAGGVAAGWVIHVYDTAPALSTLHRIEKGRSSAIYAADGSLLGFIHSNNIRQPVGSRAIPQNLKDATVAIEDHNFYNHGGIDPAGIVRAAWEDLLAGGKPVQGASTITQQLVRNLYIQNPEDTIERKVKEAHLANDMEHLHSKRWILTAYLNSAPYGTVEGETAVGVEAAAETYYGKHAKQLTLTEAAMIAGLPQAPSAYNPFLDPKAALDRRNEVLKAMTEQGYIGPARYRKARSSGLGLSPGDKYRTIREPFLFDFVQQELIDRYGVNTVRNGGLKAYTTIDPTLQDYAQAAVDACGVCYSGGGPAAALASVDPTNGEIVALASSQGEYSEDNQFNYAFQAHRQPGSSFKTFVLSTAIKQGVDPYSTYYDGTSPKTLTTPDGATWTVNNAEPGGGVMPLSEATWDSVNVVFAQLDLDVGPENVTRTAHQMGITSPLDSLPAEAIGGLRVGVTPLEMASAYATLASGGIHHKPTAVSRVEFPGGKVEQTDPDSGNRVLTEGEAYDVTKLLEGVITQGTGAGYTSIGCASEAGKTGTSEGESDAWFAGYTPMFSTAVWVGHPESRDPTGFGGPTAGPIWQSFMSAAQGGECPDFPVPTDTPTLHSLHSSNTRSAAEVPSTGSTAPSSGAPDSGSGGQGPGQQDNQGQGATPPTTAPASPSPPPAVGGGLTPGGGVSTP